MVPGLLLALLAATPGFRVDLASRLNLRWAEPESVRVSWFQSRAALSFEPLRTDRVAGRVGVELRATGFPGASSVLEPGRAGEAEPVEVLLGEAFVRLFDIVPGLNLGLGRQLVHWGTADAVNPTSLLCPPDYTDPLAWDARRPSWLAHLEYAPAPVFGVELAWRPVFSPALTGTSGWFPTAGLLPSEEELRLGLYRQFVEQGLPPDTARAWADRYDITVGEDYQLPGNRLADGGWGGRAKTRLGPIDVSAGILRGHDFLPAVTPVTLVRPELQELDFRLVTRYPRATFFGADFATDLFGAGLWAEAALTRYDDTLPEDRVDLIVGADYTLAGVYANLQYLRGRFPLALVSGQATGDYLLGAVERSLAGERVLLRLGGVVEVGDGSWGLTPLVRWLPFGGVELELGGLLFADGTTGETGTGDTPKAFGPLRDHDELFLGFRYRF